MYSAEKPKLDERLDSWKEIALYLRRTVRTVQRWENKESLPVHRIAHDRRGSVYAFRSELDRWWTSRQATKSGRFLRPEPVPENIRRKRSVRGIFWAVLAAGLVIALIAAATVARVWEF